MSAATMTRLRDLGSWRGGNTPSKANDAYWTDGTVPWVSPKDMKVDEIAGSEDRVTEAAVSEGRVSLVPSGSVLFVTRSGILSHTFPVAMTRLPVTINQDLKALTPKAGVLAKYVAHAVRGASQRILKQCSKHGTTVASVDTNALLDFEIPLVSLDQQRTIVAEIEKQFSRLDEAVANLQRVKANLGRYKAAVLRAAFDGSIVETDAERARKLGQTTLSREEFESQIDTARRLNWRGPGKWKAAAAPGDDVRGSLPEGWALVSWEAVLAAEDGAFKRGPFGSTLTKSNFVDSGFKVYEQYCPINDDCSFARYYITPAKFEEMRAFEVRAGDFLISCSGVTLGRITRVPEQFEKGVINQALLRVRLATDVVAPSYFLHLFRSPQFQRYLFDRSAGAAIPNLRGVGELKAIPIAVPPMPEQHRIVAEVDRRLSIVREVDAEVEANLKRAQALRQAILASAFGV